ncbi:hypothetical protein NDU88_000490, partial [Pleurodeles waltl]
QGRTQRPRRDHHALGSPLRVSLHTTDTTTGLSVEEALCGLTAVLQKGRLGALLLTPAKAGHRGLDVNTTPTGALLRGSLHTTDTTAGLSGE